MIIVRFIVIQMLPILTKTTESPLRKQFHREAVGKQSAGGQILVYPLSPEHEGQVLEGFP